MKSLIYWTVLLGFAGKQTPVSSAPAIPRQDWYALSRSEKNRFLDAIETALDRGLYQRFLSYHVDRISARQAHQTCAFATWHQVYLRGFERMLQSLDAHLFIPYWNIMDEYQDLHDGHCDSYLTCSAVLWDIGGPPAGYTSRRMGNVTATGTLYAQRPMHKYRDQDGQMGIVRGEFLDWDQHPPSAQWERVLDQIASTPDFARYTRLLQTTLHDNVHDTVGGFMPTNASPSDVVFLLWHSTMDMLLYVHRQCHGESVATSRASLASCNYTVDTGQLFPAMLQSSEPVSLYMKNAVGTDIRNDARIGSFFAHATLEFANVSSMMQQAGYNGLDYHLPRRLQELLVQRCPSSTYTYQPTPAPVLVTSSPTRAPVPTSTNWTQVVHDRLTNYHPHRPDIVDEQMEIYACLVVHEMSLTSFATVQAFVTGQMEIPLQCRRPTMSTVPSRTPVPSSSWRTCWNQAGVALLLLAIVGR